MHLQLVTVLYMNIGVQKISDTAQTITVAMYEAERLRNVCDNADELWHTTK